MSKKLPPRVLYEYSRLMPLKGQLRNTLARYSDETFYYRMQYRYFVQQTPTEWALYRTRNHRSADFRRRPKQRLPLWAMEPKTPYFPMQMRSTLH